MAPDKIEVGGGRHEMPYHLAPFFIYNLFTERRTKNQIVNIDLLSIIIYYVFCLVFGAFF